MRISGNLAKNVTKSGMMLGLGETDKEIYQVLVDLCAHADKITK